MSMGWNRKYISFNRCVGRGQVDMCLHCNEDRSIDTDVLAILEVKKNSKYNNEKDINSAKKQVTSYADKLRHTKLSITTDGYRYDLYYSNGSIFTLNISKDSFFQFFEHLSHERLRALNHLA